MQDDSESDRGTSSSRSRLRHAIEVCGRAQALCQQLVIPTNWLPTVWRGTLDFHSVSMEEFILSMKTFETVCNDRENEFFLKWTTLRIVGRRKSPSSEDEFREGEVQGMMIPASVGSLPGSLCKWQPLWYVVGRVHELGNGSSLELEARSLPSPCAPMHLPGSPLINFAIAGIRKAIRVKPCDSRCPEGLAVLLGYLKQQGLHFSVSGQSMDSHL